VLISVEAESTAAGRIRSIEKSNDLIGNRIRDLPGCSIVPQRTTLPRAIIIIPARYIGDFAPHVKIVPLQGR
jgi:hypothetical protein